jgi:uncharacterized protein YfiM (DUF2279 family)
VSELARFAMLLAGLTSSTPGVQPATDTHIMWSMESVQLVRCCEGAAVAQQPADAWLGSDKFRHFWMSYATSAFAFAGARAAGLDADAALLVSLPVAGAAGIGKEVHDRRRGGIFSVRDLVADALGIGAAYFLLREVR